MLRDGGERDEQVDYDMTQRTVVVRTDGWRRHAGEADRKKTRTSQAVPFRATVFRDHDGGARGADPAPGPEVPHLPWLLNRAGGIIQQRRPRFTGKPAAYPRHRLLPRGAVHSSQWKTWAAQRGHKIAEAGMFSPQGVGPDDKHSIYLPPGGLNIGNGHQDAHLGIPGAWRAATGLPRWA